jgi:hydroxymethylpyrimidine kinase / phosphomethylpyrimidine kinase / thiamine-phosphate diphosphorylase
VLERRQGHFHRASRKKEGSSVTWGTLQALSKNPRANIIIYHKGDIGKEPMIITVFGKNPGKVAAKIKEILKNY